jgi:hypothetical protein
MSVLPWLLNWPPSRATVALVLLLTVLSVGIAAGVLVGQSPITTQHTARPPDRTRVIAETSWANRSGDAPIVDAIIEGLAEAEEFDPLELNPLYDQLDPDILAHLRSQNGSQWQLLFYVDECEVRVSSHGTVTIYRIDQQPAPVH